MTPSAVPQPFTPPSWAAASVATSTTPTPSRTGAHLAGALGVAALLVLSAPIALYAGILAVWCLAAEGGAVVAVVLLGISGVALASAPALAALIWRGRSLWVVAVCAGLTPMVLMGLLVVGATH